MSQGHDPRPYGPTDERHHKIEDLISSLLRLGVITSLSVVIFGMVLSLIQHPRYLHSKVALKALAAPGATFPRTLGQVVAGVLNLEGLAIASLGLLLLVALPVLRVLLSIFAFFYQRDWAFVMMTTLVFLLLLLSFVLGKGAG